MAWESGLRSPTLDRSLALLRLRHPSADIAQLSALDLEQRHAALLRLRAEIFGPTMECVTACARCGEQVEFELDALDLSRAGGPHDTPLEFESGPWMVRLNLPTTDDLRAALARGPEGARVLRERCVVEARHRDHGAVEPTGIPDDTWRQLDRFLARECPLLAPDIGSRCPACEHEFEIDLDVDAYVWLEFEQYVRSMLHDVHLLAIAYGWTEAEILGLGPGRRGFYLEQLHS